MTCLSGAHYRVSHVRMESWCDKGPTAYFPTATARQRRCPEFEYEPGSDEIEQQQPNVATQWSNTKWN